jgi:hypothetical protein
VAGPYRTGQYRFRTGDQALVRQINLSVIMHHLREKAPVSRAELAELTGLNKTTVSSLVRELIDRQFVREVGYEEPGSRQGAGRLAVLLTPDPAAGFIVSAELGVDFMLVTTANFAPEIIWRHKEAISPEMGQQVILDRLLAHLHQAINEGCQICNTLLGVAVGVPGLVEQASGSLIFAPNLRWENIISAQPRALMRCYISVQGSDWEVVLYIMAVFTAGPADLAPSLVTLPWTQKATCAIAATGDAGRRRSASAPCSGICVGGLGRAGRLP